ncbi:hypothetical protein CKO35_12485 [Ectothiorhodospira shaposhnikovii]|uniref:HDOD domain-containing protein n=1 Tax=Ectothiorhodospira shaposhnikovii TaxID=1054 RepID=UPI001906572A|nr:HDOD domain-containing protein [Ectothiorhodospira shaposhnikovii]MBK1674105.1 hypothetical protein [Ectothiorhodospira shaposhnikovii]
MDKRQLDEWLGAFGGQDLPLLPGTALLLGDLESDALSSMRLVARLIQWDVGLALNVIRMANAVPHRHFRTEVVSLDEATMMIGIQGIHRCLEKSRPLDQLLDPAARERYFQLAAQATYAAMLAESWGTLRNDMVPGEVALAALLFNLGELALAVHQERRIARYLSLMENTEVLPHEAEYVALNLSLKAVGHRLAGLWKLPDLVRHCMCPSNARHPRPLGVMLAAKLARHAIGGWCCPVQARDLRLVMEYLDADIESVVEQLNRVSREFNLNLNLYGDLPAVPDLEAELIRDQWISGISSQRPVFCLAPRRDSLDQAEATLQSGKLGDEGEVLDVLLAGLHQGVGLNRVVFARLDEAENQLVPVSMVGTDYEPDFNRMTIDLYGRHLLTVLMKRPASFWLNPGNVDEMWYQVPQSLRDIIGVRAFFAHSLFAGDRPLGLVYADRRFDDCALDKKALSGFNRLVALAQAELLRLDQEAGAKPRPRVEPIRTLR